MHLARQRPQLLPFSLSLFVLTAVPAAQADDSADPETVTGGDVCEVDCEPDADIQAQNEEKLRRAASSMAQVTARAKAAIEPDTKLLSVSHAAQIHSFYCGPASGFMILKYLGVAKSKVTGQPLSQDVLGNKHHMVTWINKVTSWSSGLFRIGLNKFRLGTSTGDYSELHAPTATQFKNAVHYNVSRGFPLAADTVELEDEVHYNGHPRGQTIGHWIVVTGYKGYGDTARFADPSTSVWPGVAQYFEHASSTFATRYLQHNGIVW